MVGNAVREDMCALSCVGPCLAASYNVTSQECTHYDFTTRCGKETDSNTATLYRTTDCTRKDIKTRITGRTKERKKEKRTKERTNERKKERTKKRKEKKEERKSRSVCASSISVNIIIINETFRSM